MKTLCQIHVEKARQYNRLMRLHAHYGNKRTADIARQIRDDHMRRARNAQGGGV